MPNNFHRLTNGCSCRAGRTAFRSIQRIQPARQRIQAFADTRRVVPIPLQYVLGAVLILGGLVTAWVGPDLKDEDDPARERSPRQRLLIRLFGLALALCGVVVIGAALLGFRPPPNGAGPLF
jgi:hypothetical protein